MMISVSITGDKEMAELMNKLQKLMIQAPVQLSSWQLRSSPRSKSSMESESMTNAEIVEKLIEEDRNFFELTNDQLKGIARAGEATLETMINAYVAMGQTIQPAAIFGAVAKAVTAKACEYITENIENGKGIKNIRPASPGWTAKKVSKGLSSKVGIMTGQVLSNFSPAAVARNIVLKR
jgi:hypothetical protein